MAAARELECVGRYVLHPPFAKGGMATVHAARLVGAEGFTRLVAAKRLHAQYMDDPEFVGMFRDEARIASKIHHPNVVPVLDVVLSGEELILVQEYVHGVPLSQLLKASVATGCPIDLGIAVAILAGMLAGLHAAHEAKDERGEPLGIVHRDVSPQNVLVGVDGIPRLVDFGIAKAKTSVSHTREGVFKGKLAYMAPECLRGQEVGRRADVYAAGVVAWELLVNRRFNEDYTELDFVQAVAAGTMPTMLEVLSDDRAAIDDARWAKLAELDAVLARALASRPEERFATAEEMSLALQSVCVAASASDVAKWVAIVGAELLGAREKMLAANEESWRAIPVVPLAPVSEVKIAAPVSETRPTMPESSLATPAAAFARTSRPPAIPISPSSLTPVPDEPRARSSALVPLAPWIVTGALLLVTGILVGLVSARGETADPKARVEATAPAAAIALPPVIVKEAPTAPPSASAAEADSVGMRAPRTAQPPVVYRWTPPPPKPAPTPTPPPVAAATPSARTDCNPPFYFDGTKKVFKPACL